MSFTDKCSERVISYISGLLNYYGAIEANELLKLVNRHLQLELERQDLDDIVAEALNKDCNSHLFKRRRDIFYNIEVDDLKTLLIEQESRNELFFRPVTEKEAESTLSFETYLAGIDGAKQLVLFLESKNWSATKISEKLRQATTIGNNNHRPIKIIEFFLSDLELEQQEEADLFVGLVGNFMNHYPHWALKGWTPEEVFEGQETPDLSPQTDEQYVQESLFSNQGEKTGRNKPCPCGSGKKHKKCCGSVSASENSDVQPSSAKKTRGEAFEPEGMLGADIREHPKTSPQVEEPTDEEWKELFFAAEIFKTAKCWEWMFESDIFGVKNPESGEIAYVSIMGSGGEDFSLNAYLGSEGLNSFYGLLDAEDEGQIFEAFSRLESLVASFEDRNDLSKEDLDLIKRLDLKFRGKKQWPQFRVHEPGLYPWKIDSAQCRFLTILLQQAFGVSLMCKEDKAILDGEEQEHHLVRTFERVGGQEFWVDKYMEPEDAVIHYNAYALGDSFLLRKMIKSLKRVNDVWEADTFYIATPVREKRGDRPYLPLLFMVADQSKEMIMTFRMLTDLESDSQMMLDALLDLIESGGKLPKRLLVEKRETYVYLEAICDQLEIDLQMVERLKFMPALRDETNRYKPIN